MPIPALDGLADRRHPEWRQHVHWWRWLAHSLEGGDTYRDATYGTLSYADAGLSAFALGREMPVRNLYRYKLEVPNFEKGDAEHPDYALRLARTPVPTHLPDAIESHLAEIYAQDVERSHADPTLAEVLDRWWSNVDGSETSADEWFPEVVMPYLLALGCLDLAFDRPAVPEGESAETGADDDRLGLDRCIAAIVWPWNVLDWELDLATKAYEWVLNLECGGPMSSDRVGEWRLRLWTEDEWVLLDGNSRELGRGVHPYGRVPQFRAFDRQNPCKGHVGRARYEAIADIQRAAYNTESEIKLSTARHSYPILQAPKRMIEDAGGGDIPITPSRIVQMCEGRDGSAQGLEFVEPPQGPGDSLRRDQERHQDQADRAARLTKPAGTRGTDGSTVAQSGISKLVDERPGRQLCKQIARTAYKAEWMAAVFALEVLLGRPVTQGELDGLKVVYPSDFDLMSADDWTDLVLDFYASLDRAGTLPELDEPILRRYARLVLPGRDDEAYEPIDDAIRRFVGERTAEREQGRAALEAAQAAQAAGAAGQEGEDGEDEQQDPDAAQPRGAGTGRIPPRADVREAATMTDSRGRYR